MSKAIEQAAPSTGRPAAGPTTKVSWKGGMGGGGGATFQGISKLRDKADRLGEDA